MIKRGKTKPLLCYRCEIRASILEGDEHIPRYECGDTTRAVTGCYLFVPTLPPVLKKAKGDRRPFPAGSVFSGRVEAVRHGKVGKEFYLSGIDFPKREFSCYWRGSTRDEKKQ